MNKEYETVCDQIIQQIDETMLTRIEGWDSLSAFAERVALDDVAIKSVEGSNGKWTARGIVSLVLLNWDDERFGEVRLHLLASGHSVDTDTVIDSIIISPHLH